MISKIGQNNPILTIQKHLYNQNHQERNHPMTIQPMTEIIDDWAKSLPDRILNPIPFMDPDEFESLKNDLYMAMYYSAMSIVNYLFHLKNIDELGYFLENMKNDSMINHDYVMNFINNPKNPHLSGNSIQTFG
jgi:hypothetical protein